MMMNAPLSPPPTPNADAVAAAHALIALITDPTAAQKRLDEIKAATDAANEAYAKLQTDTAEHNKVKAETESASVSRETELDAREAELTKLIESNEAVAKTLDSREVMDREIKSKLDARVADLDTREATVYRRETAAVAKEAELAARQQQLIANEVDYATRMSKLKELTA